MIPFNVPPYIGKEDQYVLEAIHSHKICGDGAFTKRCHAALEAMTGTKKALLTTSGTSALELAAILDVQADVGVHAAAVRLVAIEVAAAPLADVADGQAGICLIKGRRRPRRATARPASRSG